MSESKFKVGEAVMIRSRFRPEYNCDSTIVESVVYAHITDASGGPKEWGYAYLTAGDSRTFNGDQLHWKESALRKRPKPADQSYDEMIKELETEFNEYGKKAETA